MKHDLRWFPADKVDRTAGVWRHIFRCPCGRRKRLSYAEMPHTCECGRGFDIDRVGT